MRATISRHVLPPISWWGTTVSGDSVEVVGLPRETEYFLVPEKGKVPLRKTVTTIWCMFDSPFLSWLLFNVLTLCRRYIFFTRNSSKKMFVLLFPGDLQNPFRITQEIISGNACHSDLVSPRGPRIEKIKSRLKFSFSLEIFNLDLQNSSQKQ